MPGGKGNIRPEDGKQFEKGNKVAAVWTEQIALKFGNDLLEWLKSDNENIFYNEFIFMVAKGEVYHPEAKIYPGLISYLKKKFTSFSKLYEKAKKMQEIKLVKFGCFDKLNASMTKFTLINNHNYKDHSEVDQRNSGEITITRRIINGKDE